MSVASVRVVEFDPYHVDWLDGEILLLELTSQSDVGSDLIQKPVAESWNWREAGKLVHAWKIGEKINDYPLDYLTAELDAL